MSSDASWSVTSDYVRKSCVMFATLSDKGGDFAGDAASNLDRLRNKTLSEVLCARLGTRHVSRNMVFIQIISRQNLFETIWKGQLRL